MSYLETTWLIVLTLTLLIFAFAWAGRRLEKTTSPKNERQQLLDRAYRHIMEQGGPGWSLGACAYRTPRGAVCAAGIFITDYDPKMECRGFIGVVDVFPDSVDPMAARHKDFVDSIQSCHDSAAKLAEGRPGQHFLDIFHSRVHRLVALEGYAGEALEMPRYP